MMKNGTTIGIYRTTHARLEGMMEDGESFDAVINRLLEKRGSANVSSVSDGRGNDTTDQGGSRLR